MSQGKDKYDDVWEMWSWQNNS